MRMKSPMLIVTCFVLALVLTAGSPPSADEARYHKLVEKALTKLAHEDQFFYRYSVSSVLPGGAKGRIDGSVFKSTALRILYTESGKDADFRCIQGGLLVRDADKNVYWHRFKNDSEYYRAVTVAEPTIDAFHVLDSLFLKEAKLKKVTNGSNRIMLNYSYPMTGMIRNAAFVIDPKTTRLISMSYDLVRGTGAYLSGETVDSIRQSVVMEGFSKAMPDAVARLMKEPIDEDRLKILFKNYTVKKI